MIGCVYAALSSVSCLKRNSFFWFIVNFKLCSSPHFLSDSVCLSDNLSDNLSDCLSDNLSDCLSVFLAHSRTTSFSLTHALAHSLLLSLAYSLTHSLTHLFTHSLVFSLPLTHSTHFLPHSLFHSLFTHSSTHSLACTQNRAFKLTHIPRGQASTLTHSHFYFFTGTTPCPFTGTTASLHRLTRIRTLPTSSWG